MVPASELAAAPFGDDPAYRLLAQPAAAFLVAQYDTPPMDNIGVRQALSLAIDREALIAHTLLPAGVSALPATSIIPPGMAGGPGGEAVGAGYDPGAARAALSDAGYADCKGLPPITLLVDDAFDVSQRLAAVLIQQWEDVLGCPVSAFKIDKQPLFDLYTTLQTQPLSGAPPRPGLILLGWEADYPDAYHWLADVFGCHEFFPTAYLDQARACIDADSQVLDAATLQVQDARAETLSAAGDAFFGPSGEMPLIPLYYYARPLAIAQGLEAYPLHAGPLAFDRWVMHADQ